MIARPRDRREVRPGRVGSVERSALDQAEPLHLRSATDELGGQRQEQLMDATQAQELAEQVRPALAQDDPCPELVRGDPDGHHREVPALVDDDRTFDPKSAPPGSGALGRGHDTTGIRGSARPGWVGSTRPRRVTTIVVGSGSGIPSSRRHAAKAAADARWTWLAVQRWVGAARTDPAPMTTASARVRSRPITNRSGSWNPLISPPLVAALGVQGDHAIDGRDEVGDDRRLIGT